MTLNSNTMMQTDDWLDSWNHGIYHVTKLTTMIG